MCFPNYSGNNGNFQKDASHRNADLMVAAGDPTWTVAVFGLVAAETCTGRNRKYAPATTTTMAAIMTSR
jgi:hypothetical protein